MRVMCLAAFAAFALAAVGCSAFAGKSDYADYRSIRLARDPDSRLYALQRYAERHPDGRWSGEVDDERRARETETFESGKSTRAGLERYLRAYPEGTFAVQARSRLSAVELIERRRREEDAQTRQLTAARKEREQELSRTWVTRFAGYWASTLLKLEAWGSPIPEVARQNPQFSRAFGATPRPRCTADECVKYYASAYGIPVPGGTRVERVLSLVLRLRMREGKLERAELLMPGQGFSRWYELEHRKVVASGDAALRKQAVTWALDRLQQAVRPDASELAPLASHALAPIPVPAIGPTGEITDTTAEDPSEPAKQLALEPGTSPDIEAMVKPKGAEPAPDMVFSPLGVTKEGRTFSTEQPKDGAPAAPAAEGGGEVMVLDVLTVPKEGAAGGNAQAPATPAAAPEAAAPLETVDAVVRAFQGRGLRIVLFSAPSTNTGADAYDGLLIERLGAPAAAAPGKPVKPKR